MAYVKQNFEDGLTLYASQLNHIEDGIVELENREPAIADGSVTEKKTTFFTEKFVELFGELEVGFRDNSLSGYHKKTIPVEPGKTYIVNWSGWMDYFDANMTAITGGYTIVCASQEYGNDFGSTWVLTIPEGSALRYIRTTIQDKNMTDSLPSCYEGNVNVGQIIRGTTLAVFDYANNEVVQNTFEVYSGENLIDGSRCTVVSGTTYLSQLVPVKAGEKYYMSSGTGGLRLFNHCGKQMPHKWVYPDDWMPDTGTPVTGSQMGVYTIPEGAYFAAATTTLTNGKPDHWLVKSPKKITSAQLGKPFIDSDISREFAKEYFESQHLNGLKLACLGDSVTNMSQYGSSVAQKYGMTYVHGAQDGARYTAEEGYSENIAYWKVYNLASDADVVVLMFGTNDVSNSLPIGEFTDNTLYTLYGALRKTFDLLTTKYTGKRIGVVTSPQRDFSVNGIYDRWMQYNGIIKKMAMLYKIPVLDGEYAGLVFGLADDYDHFTDQVHPSGAGASALAYNIGKFIESLPIYHRDGE